MSVLKACRKPPAVVLALLLLVLAGCSRAGTPPVTPALLAATFDYSTHAPRDGRVHIDY